MYSCDKHSKINIERNIILLPIDDIEKMTYFMRMNFFQKKKFIKRTVLL